MLPALAFYLIFHYIPMAGAVIVFKNYSTSLGVFGSPWAGTAHFKDFFSSYYFIKILGNTVVASPTLSHPRGARKYLPGV